MKQLAKGEYYGHHYLKTELAGIIISDTEYVHEYVDWHYHENPYFTFLLQGQLVEENKKSSYQLTSNSLVFHNWQDNHRNFKPNVYTRGAHVEITDHWLKKYGMGVNLFEGSVQIKNPRIKNRLVQILVELRTNDAFSAASIDLLLIDILESIDKDLTSEVRQKPEWTNQLEELIYEKQDALFSLDGLSLELGIHPVHLSRSFRKYYHITFGQFCREIRLNRAISELLSSNKTMTEIAYEYHFSDQSHMIACFKKHFKLTPRQLKILIG